MNDVMTPEEYELLLSLGGDNAQLEQDMAMQQAMAEQLRQSMPQGQMAGRVYVAPNVLQFAGKLAGDKASTIQGNKARESGRAMGANTQQQNRMIMQGILKGNAPTGPAQMPEQYSDPYGRFRQAGDSA